MESFIKEVSVVRAGLWGQALGDPIPHVQFEQPSLAAVCEQPHQFLPSVSRLARRHVQYVSATHALEPLPCRTPASESLSIQRSCGFQGFRGQARPFSPGRHQL